MSFNTADEIASQLLEPSENEQALISMLKRGAKFIVEPDGFPSTTIKCMIEDYLLQKEIIKSMAEEIFIKRAWSMTSEESLKRSEERIIGEHIQKVLKKRGKE